MSFSAPTPPDPTQTSNTQQQYNVAAAGAQNKANSYNQSSPYGSISYVPDANSPSGYSLNTSLSPTQQGLYNTQTGTQGVAGQTARNLLENTSSMYSQPFNGENKAVTDQLNRWSQNYVQPIFDQQSSNLEAQLRNQGLTPGSQAYDNAKNLLARNQGDVTNQYLQQNQGQAYNQAAQSYQMPLQTLAGLYGMAAPTGPSQLNTPTAQIQPANYSGAVQSNYQNEMQNYQNNWNNIGKLGTAGIGLAMAPMTGGTSLAGMFGKGVTGGGWG